MAAFLKRKLVCPSNEQMLNGNQNKMGNGNGTTSSDLGNLPHTQRFR